MDTAEHSEVVEGARAASDVGSQGTTPQSQEPSSGWTITVLELGLFFRMGDMEVALGYEDYCRGLEKLKAELLKERRRHLKNDFFWVSDLTSLF